MPQPAREYFHGTRWPYKPGQRVKTRAEHGGAPTNAPVGSAWKENPDAANWVYMTTDRTAAWLYAHAAASKGDPAVFLVLPLDSVEHDAEHAGLPAYRCRSVIVLDHDRGKPLTAEEAESRWIPENPNERAAIKDVTRSYYAE